VPQVRAKSNKKKPRFEDLVALQARLLGPGGCPWDREQTHETLRTYLLEETYEVLEALESGDPEKLSSELGDLLLQVVFHAALAKQQGQFDIRNVIERVYTKLVRRHPHVFGEAQAKTSAAVLRNWEELKAEERRAENEQENESLLGGIPRNLPALLEAFQLTRRASRIGFDWENIEGLLDKLNEEAGELRRALQREKSRRGGKQTEEEVGDLLFVAVNVARFLGVDPEIALKQANRKFKARFEAMEREAARRGPDSSGRAKRLADVSRKEMEALWEQSKEKE
jgi:MazG family protein